MELDGPYYQEVRAAYHKGAIMRKEEAEKYLAERNGNGDGKT